jgi:hypothetical protein
MDKTTWFVEGDTDGDGQADFVVALTLPPESDFNFGDFVL